MNAPIRWMPRLMLACLVAALLAGCGSDPNSVSEQANAGDRKGYIAGDGKVVTIPSAKRGSAVTLSGTTLDGTLWRIADQRGNVVVVNLWASWCGPCQQEAPAFVKVANEMKLAKAPVTFIGIDYREPPANGRAQAKAWGLPYPSITDETGATALQMNGVLTTQPATAILDRTGRVAAIATTPLDAKTLTGMISDAVAER